MPFNVDCPACNDFRIHTDGEFAEFHPPQGKDVEWAYFPKKAETDAKTTKAA